MTVLGWIAVPILLGCVALLVIAVTTDGVIVQLVDQIDGRLPDLLGSVQVLSRPEDRLGAEDVHGPQAQHDAECGLAVLSGDQDDDVAEPEPAIGSQLEGVDQQPLLPGKQLDEQELLGELDDRVAEAGFRREFAEWTSPDPWHLTADQGALLGGG